MNHNPFASLMPGLQSGSQLSLFPLSAINNSNANAHHVNTNGHNAPNPHNSAFNSFTTLTNLSHAHPKRNTNTSFQHQPQQQQQPSQIHHPSQAPLSAMNLSSITGNNTQKPKKGKAKSKKAQQAHHEDCPCCGSANKPYQCDWPNCFKRFRQRPHLQAHQNIHTGVRFICEFPGCGKSFVRKYNLQEHSKLHTNRNPNICSFPDCNKFFSSKYSLTRHQAAQHQI